MDASYQIYHPDYPGIKWVKVSKDGKTDNVVLDAAQRESRTDPAHGGS